MQVIDNYQNINYDHLFKILLVGDSGVGKSSLMLRFADNSFTGSYISTIGVDFKIKTVKIKGKIVKLQLWDTAGQERFKTITTAYYRGAHAVIVAYDTTCRLSFNNIRRWMSDLDKECSNGVVKVLVGCKTDLINIRDVDTKEGKRAAVEFGMDFIETSAADRTNVDQSFELIAERLLEKSSATQVLQNGGFKDGRIATGVDLVPPQTSNTCCFGLATNRDPQS